MIFRSAFPLNEVSVDTMVIFGGVEVARRFRKLGTLRKRLALVFYVLSLRR